MLRISDVLIGVGSHNLPHAVSPDLCFADVTNDSRLATRGALFVALRDVRDGHDFIPDAYRKGAAGVIAERLIDLDGWLERSARRDFAYIIVDDCITALQKLSAYWRSKHGIQVVGVTGSVGKTSTKEMIATVLSEEFRVLSNEKNMNNEIGLPLSLLRLDDTHEKAVLEMGMYDIGEINLLCAIARPQIGVVTNVSHSHLERLWTIERIAQAKSELVEALPDDGIAILNGDDPLVSQMAAKTGASHIFFGTGSECDVRATRIRVNGLKGISFDLVYDGKTARVKTPLLGRHTVYPCLAAAAVGIAQGMSLDEIARALKKAPSTVRLQALPGKNRSSILDDTYNASPVSTNAALDLLAKLRGRRIAILGDMFELGSYEEQGHREVGRRAARSVDRLIVVGKRARWIGDEALSAGLKAVEFAETNAGVSIELQPNDYVLVKGSRGMRMEEIVARLVEEGG